MYHRKISCVSANLVTILNLFLLVFLVILSDCNLVGKAYRSEFIGTKYNEQHLTNGPSTNGNNNAASEISMKIFKQEDLTKGNTNTNAHQSEHTERGDTKTRNIPAHTLRTEYNGNTREESEGVTGTRDGKRISEWQDRVYIDEALPSWSDFQIVEGDILLPQIVRGKNLVLSKYQLWPDKTVFYDFVNSEFTIFERNLVEDAIQDLRMHTCVRFVQRTSQPTYLRFRNNGLGCAGPVGYINLGSGIDIFLGGSVCFKRGKIQHEILHSLGFWHEHTRSDRDSYIRVVSENIGPGYEVNMVKRPQGTVRTFGMPYDYGSIMHYSGKAFSKDGSSSTIIPLYPGAENIMGQRDGLSRVDLAKINLLYKCSKDYYRGSDIKGYYSTFGPIPELGFLPANSGWFYKIGEPGTEHKHKVIQKFFNNTHHFSHKPGADHAKLVSLNTDDITKKINITYNL
ncbi:hypothetical protein WDU94_012852 [Cyamophila willieti]